MTEINIEKKPNIIYPISLSQIKGKEYKNVVELLSDVKWFAHNCRALHPMSQSIQNAAINMVDSVKEDIKYILSCAECYKNVYEYGENASVKICSKPHVLVWAKFQSYDYWPAKVLSVTAKQKLYVRFFGDDSFAEMAPDQCLLFTEAYPGKINSDVDDAFNLAIKVSIFKTDIKVFHNHNF